MLGFLRLLLHCSFACDGISCNLGQLQTHKCSRAGFELILFIPPSKCWNSRCVLFEWEHNCLASVNICVPTTSCHKCVYFARVYPLHTLFCPSRNQLYPQNRRIIFFQERLYILVHLMYFCIFPINSVYFI